MRISVIIPALNEEGCIGATLRAVAGLAPFEILVADGGSTDRTVELAAVSCRVVQTVRGRGAQQAAGASLATGDVLWFVHADCVPAGGSLDAIRRALADPRVVGGNFSLRFDAKGLRGRLLTTIYPWLGLLGLCYGDSGIFVRSSVYRAIGGFRGYPLFEDVDLVRRIRRAGRFRTVEGPLVASSRRFADRNFALVFAEWTALQVLYWAGVSPERLARFYAPVREREDRR